MEQTFISQDVKENIKENFGRSETIPPEFQEKKKKKKIRISRIIPAVLLVITGILNLVSLYSVKFSDWYTANIFPLWQKTYGRLTSMCRYSIGEMLIVLAIALIPLSVVVLVLCLIRKKGRRLKTLGNFVTFWAWIITVVALVMTLNCFILYRCSTFADLNNITVTKHSHEDLEKMGEIIVNETNSLGEQVNRDENGKFVLTENLNAVAKQSVKNLSENYKNLDGFYVTPKPVYSSFFMSQLNIMGVYFPFSMEANYNNDMPKLRVPETICHELAHTKGYIQEDEASFIAFVACDKSESVEFRYSGYISALLQVRNKIFSYATDEQKKAFDQSISENVWVDIQDNFDYWQKVENAKDTFIDSKKAGEISDKAVDASLKFNGVKDGMESYGRVVDLLLEYFSE